MNSIAIYGGGFLKRKTSKEILAESFREVAEHKNINKITIRDITENCGYSAATFYRQFKDKYDLIAWDYSRKAEEIMSGMNGSQAEWHNALTEAANFIKESKTYLANLFLHTSGLESFITNMREVNYQCLKNVAERANGNQPVSPHIEMCIRLYVLGTTQFICEWILGKWDITAKELVSVCEEALPSSLQKHLQ